MLTFRKLNSVRGLLFINTSSDDLFLHFDKLNQRFHGFLIGFIVALNFVLVFVMVLISEIRIAILCPIIRIPNILIIRRVK